MRQVWHIYYATKGTSGAYIDALLRASGIAGIDAVAFVSGKYRFCFGNIRKLFFPITDLFEIRNRVILVIRGLELVGAYVAICLMAILRRPDIVIHLVDDLFVTFCFFKVLKLLGLSVKITCHDVSSHYQGMSVIRSKLMVSADELIVHNEAAIRILSDNLGKSICNKIKTYPFPYSAFDEIISLHRLDSHKSRLRHTIGKSYYLFLGVVRRSKGIETLIQSWQIFNKEKSDRLVIAGKWTDPGDKYRKIADEDNSIAVIDRYLVDEEFVQLIRDAKFVLLPYLDYAHSAIIVSCANHGGAVIISDIDLFKYYLPEYALTFRRGDVQSLVSVLRSASHFSELEIEAFRNQLKQAVLVQNENLVDDLREAYGG
jgi:glycosyltransferase involved in cell wall biosynthesis